MSKKIIDEFTELSITPSKKWGLRNPIKSLDILRKNDERIKNSPILNELKKMWDNKYHMKKNREARKFLIKSMGNKCCQCGFDDFRALQIDHVHSDGFIERKQYRSWTTYAAMGRLLKGYEEGRYKILCANCNWIKRVEKKEHKKVSV